MVRNVALATRLPDDASHAERTTRPQRSQPYAIAPRSTVKIIPGNQPHLRVEKATRRADNPASLAATVTGAGD
jgi:hypothetical protein